MCLSHIIKRQEPSTEEQTAWKVFKQVDTLGGPTGPRLKFCHFSAPEWSPLNKSGREWNDRGIIPTTSMDKWLPAAERWPVPQPEFGKLLHKEAYARGFHCLLDPEDAHKFAEAMEYIGNFVVKEVKVRGVHTYGIQEEVKVLVCDEMYIPSDSSTEEDLELEACYEEDDYDDDDV